jgi:predicted metal-dependent hydrolase
MTQAKQKLHYGASTIDYSIIRNRLRKRPMLGRVTIRTPYNKYIEEIRELVRGKAKWIREGFTRRGEEKRGLNDFMNSSIDSDLDYEI